MTIRPLGLLAFLLMWPLVVRAQSSPAGEATDSTSLFAAIFRVAAVHGQLTSHSDAVPQVFCLARRDSGVADGNWMGRLVAPDSVVVARVRERVPKARPLSACRVRPRTSARNNRTAVVERATGRRGILIWAMAPARDVSGALVVRVGYYEHGFSTAEWTCAVRRSDDEWIVNACHMLRTS
jgi:hypothetical protein